MRKPIAIIVAAGMLVALAACSSTSNAAACTPTKSGAASNAVKVSGKFGSAPKVTFKKGLSATTTQRTVITAGKGKVAVKGSPVTVDFTVYNATTGAKLGATSYATGGAQAFTVEDSQTIPGLGKALNCATEGSRIVAVVPPADAFGSAGSTNAGVGAKDSILFVIDVESVKAVPKPTPTATPLPKANGTPQPAPAGFPTVTLDATGAPTITIPKADPPATTQIALLEKGSGAIVKTGQTVTVNYTGVVWSTGKVFDSSWTRGTPATFATSDVIPGFAKALVGQKVGSQVIAVIAPADGYGPSGGSPSAGISATDTIVFVIDILATN